MGNVMENFVTYPIIIIFAVYPFIFMDKDSQRI